MASGVHLAHIMTPNLELASQNFIVYFALPRLYNPSRTARHYASIKSVTKVTHGFKSSPRYEEIIKIWLLIIEKTIVDYYYQLIGYPYL